MAKADFLMTWLILTHDIAVGLFEVSFAATLLRKSFFPEVLTTCDIYQILTTALSHLPCTYMRFNPYLPTGLFHTYQLYESISNHRSVWCTFFVLFVIEIHVS